jgi:pimeloyl-ACP methyl ester carboxylesterase
LALLSVYNRLIRRDLVRCGVASRTVKLQGGAVHYYDAPGRPLAPPLVLVHGLADSANTWYQTIVPLARALGRVYALDLPGVGFSALPAGRDHLAIGECVEVVADFCREVVREPCVLVGHSLGGALVLRLAGRPMPWLGVAAIAAPGARIAEAEWRALIHAFDVPDRAAGRILLNRIFTAAPWPLVLIENDLRAVWRSAPVKKLIESIHAEDFLDAAELGRIHCPCLLLWGTDERLLPSSLLDAFRRDLPSHARVEVVRGWGHAPQLERPTEVTERLIAFAESLPYGEGSGIPGVPSGS